MTQHTALRFKIALIHNTHTSNYSKYFDFVSYFALTVLERWWIYSRYNEQSVHFKQYKC